MRIMCTINIMEPLELPYLDQFLTELARQDLAAHTRLNYRLDLQHFAHWFHGSTGEAFAPERVTPTDVREYRAFLINVQRRAPATVNRRLAALRKFFRWARAEKLVREDPTEAVREVELVRTAPKSLDKRQADKILREAQKDGSKRNVAILQVLRHTGLRVAELCALRLDDLELGERSGRLLVRSGKGSKHRAVPLNNEVRQAIEAYQQVRPTAETDALFIGQRGEALQPRSVQEIVAKYARLAGLYNVTPHTLRHTFGKQVLDAGANLVEVAKLMGHTNLNTTAVYTQPTAEDLEQAVQRLDPDFMEQVERTLAAGRRHARKPGR